MRQVKTGALSIMTACLVVSATLRAPAVLAALPSLPAIAASGEGGGADPAVVEGTALSRELRRLREELEVREAAVVTRETELRELEARMAERLEELRLARERLETMTAEASEAAARDVRQLSSLYARMRPKDAGRLFDAMAPAFAAGFLGDMKPEAAAAILAEMTTEKAYAVSLMLAGRHLPVADAGRAPAGAAR